MEVWCIGIIQMRGGLLRLSFRSWVELVLLHILSRPPSFLSLFFGVLFFTILFFFLWHLEVGILYRIVLNFLPLFSNSPGNFLCRKLGLDISSPFQPYYERNWNYFGC